MPTICPQRAEAASRAQGGRRRALTNGPPEVIPSAESTHATDYAHLLEGDDLSPEQQRELLETLWSLMVAFVDLGFGVNAIEALIPELAHAKQDQAETNKGAKSAETMLCSDNIKQNK